MTKDTVRNVLAGWISGAFIGSIAALYYVPIPADNKDLIVFMLGQLSGFMGAVMAFNFGTSKGSADKTAMLANRPAGTPVDPVHTTEEPAP